MSKLIIGIIIVVLLGLGVWYFYPDMMGGNSEETATTTTSTDTSTTVKPAGTNTFKSIFTQSGNHQCSYEQVTASSRSSSDIYIADGKMRGEFRTISGDDSSANLMIYDGGFLYSWKEGATVGKKSSITSLSDLPQAIPSDLTSGAIFGESLDNVSWDCHAWAKDPKFFVLPTYVKFSAAS